MSVSRHYTKAPITEAIIDFRVVPRADFSLEQVEHLADKSLDEYPSTEQIRESQEMSGFSPDGLTSASAKQQFVGIKSSSADGKYVCQRRLNGFAFSRLAPYDCWASFRDEAKRWWGLYREASAPEKITNLAVRYINRIDIPASGLELKDYFRTTPELSSDLPQEVHRFFMQVCVPYTDISAKLMVNHTIVPPAQAGGTSFILDLNLSRDVDVPQTESEIWDFFEILHKRKNEAFEACVTDKTRGFFD